MGNIILSTEVYHANGTIQPLGVDSVTTLEKAVSAMSLGFGIKMKNGTIMTAREGSESGKILLVGAVYGTRPFKASVFGHDFVVSDGKLYNIDNFSYCPRNIGVPARDRGDRTWISYLSPKNDNNPLELAENYINSAYFSGNDFSWSWQDRTHTIIQKTLRPVLDVASGVIKEFMDHPIENQRNNEERNSIAYELISICDDLIRLEDGNLSKMEFTQIHNYEILYRMENITNNSAYLMYPNYGIINKYKYLGNLLRSCYFGCNNDSHHFFNAIKRAADMSSKEHMASEIRKAVGLVDLVYTVVLGRAFSRLE